MTTLGRCCEVLRCAWVLALPVGCAFDDEFECRTLQSVDRQVADIETLPVDDEAARTWARLRIYLAETGRRVRINDNAGKPRRNGTYKRLLINKRPLIVGACGGSGERDNGERRQ